MLRRYVNFVVAYPRSIIAGVLLITAVLSVFIGRVHMLLDLDAQIPPQHPLVVVGKRIEREFGGKYMTVVGFYVEEGTIYTPEVLQKVDRVTKKLAELPGVKPGSVMSLMAPQLKDIVSGEDALEVNPLANGPPDAGEPMEAFKQRVARNALMTRLFVSDDGRSTAVLVDFDEPEDAARARTFYRLIEEAVAPERESGVQILVAGAPPVLHWLSIYTTRVAGLFLLALCMIGYLHYRAFRTIQGMLIPLVTAIMGVVWALGLMGLLGAPLDPWNVMTPVLLLAIGAGHSVQILKRYYEEYARARSEHPTGAAAEQNRAAVVEATVKVGSVMLAAGAIASLSFLSLTAFGLPSIRNFGLCTAFGIVAALIVEMTFIPAVRVLLTPPNEAHTKREQAREFFDRTLEWLATLVRERREKPILWASIAIVAVAAVGATRLQAGNSLGEQFFETNGPVPAFRMADSRLAGTRVIQVLVEGQTDAIKDPEVLQRMDSLSRFIERQPLPVGKVVSFVDVLKQLDGAIMGNDGGRLPDTKEAVAQMLLLYSMSGDESELERLVSSNYDRAVITAYIRTDDFQLMKQMTLAVQAEADRLFAGQSVEATVGGGVTNAIALNETMVQGKVWNLVQISALVVLITALMLRSLVAGLLVLLPLATAALVNLGLMGWTGILLSMGTSAISAMAVGIGADYAVYLLFRVREEMQRTGDLREAIARALTTSGKAIAYVATAVAGGYLCLAFSGFKVHVLLGALVALTMATSSLATVAFLPAVLLRISPRFLTKWARNDSERPPDVLPAPVASI